MLAAVLYGQEDLKLETVPDPEPGPGEIVLKVGVATTCGTDLKVWRRGGHARMLKPPTIFGHEAAGTIFSIGSGEGRWAIGLWPIIQPPAENVSFAIVKNIRFVKTCFLIMEPSQNI